jgi:putative DNA primase/helicase
MTDDDVYKFESELAEDIKQEQEHIRPTDLWNCEMLVRKWGSKLHFVHNWGKWILWDGKRWAPDTTGKIYQYARDTIRHLYTLAGEEIDNGERKALAAHALRSESRHKIEAMVSLAESESFIPITPDRFDRDPFLLNVSNGTIDLRSGELRDHSEYDLITKITPIKYVPKDPPQCPIWIDFLNYVMGGNERLITFLQRAVGYSLTGDCREQCFFFLHGNGCNGKSTFIETIKAVTGDYGHQARPEVILMKYNDSVPNEIAALRGKRFCATIEVEDGRRFAEVLVKQLTGQDTVSARFLYREFFEFHPEFKIWLAANHKPVIRGTDYAIWRRVRLIPWTVRIPDEEQDKTLLDKLKCELPGILKWAVEGCLKWQEEGLQAPDEVIQATEKYRSEMDVLAGFLEDRCIIDKNTQVSVAQFFNEYLQWCERNGEKPESKRSIHFRMTERGFDQYRGTGGKRYWIGIGILE